MRENIAASSVSCKMEIGRKSMRFLMPAALVVAALFAAHQVPQAFQNRLANKQKILAELKRRLEEGQRINAQVERTFVETMPSGPEIQQLVAKIARETRVRAVSATSLGMTYTAATPDKYGSVQIALKLSGDYPQMKTLFSNLLMENPTLAPLNIILAPESTLGKVSGQFSFVYYVRE